MSIDPILEPDLDLLVTVMSIMGPSRRRMSPRHSSVTYSEAASAGRLSGDAVDRPQLS